MGQDHPDELKEQERMLFCRLFFFVYVRYRYKRFVAKQFPPLARTYKREAANMPVALLTAPFLVPPAPDPCTDYYSVLGRPNSGER